MLWSSHSYTVWQLQLALQGELCRWCGRRGEKVHAVILSSIIVSFLHTFLSFIRQTNDIPEHHKEEAELVVPSYGYFIRGAQTTFSGVLRYVENHLLLISHFSHFSCRIYSILQCLDLWYFGFSLCFRDRQWKYILCRMTSFDCEFENL